VAKPKSQKRIAWARVLIYVTGVSTACFGQQTAAERWIEAGHWKRARAAVEESIHDAPNDPLANFLLSQVRGAFGDRTAPLALAEKAVALDGHAAKYHRQVAEVLGVVAQHSGAVQQLFLARRFRKEVDTALVLDPRDVQANRDLLEFYLLAPGIAGGSRREAAAIADRIAAIDPAEGFLAKARIASARADRTTTELLLKKAAAAQPPSYRARLALANFYLASEPVNLAEAEAAGGELIQLDPGRSDGYAVLAAVYAERGSWDQLDGVLLEAARSVPDDLFPYYRVAECMILRGANLDRAERYLRVYRAQEPEGNRPALADADRSLARIGAMRRATGNRHEGVTR
jgi:tetratricopeptide (TPR) repeat protein